MDNPDAVEPEGKVWDHWVGWTIPADTPGLPEDWRPATVGAVEGPNSPDREHTHRFVAYALDTDLDPSTGASKADFEDAGTGHVVESATLEGTYAP